MEQHLEIEFKSEINHEDYLKIRAYFPFETPALQENIYYDTEDFKLYKQGIMCRIRKVNDRFIFTLKEPREDGVMEYEFIMDGDLYTDDRAKTLLMTYNVGLLDLVEVSFSNTIRYEFKDVYGMWCLDITQFKSHKDYEIEYELYQEEPAAQKHYLQTLKAIGIEYREIDPKFIRALNSALQTSKEDVV